MSREHGVGLDARWPEIDRRIRCALRQLQEVDGFLLNEDANERSITHRLAIHLHPHFPGWDIDVEYNRERTGGRTKQMPDWEELDWERIADGASREKLLRDMEARTVYPDIIVHCRGKNENLLAVEVKKSGRAGEVDRWKLRVIRNQAGLNYRHAAFLQLPTDDSPESPFVLEPIN